MSLKIVSSWVVFSVFYEQTLEPTTILCTNKKSFEKADFFYHMGILDTLRKRKGKLIVKGEFFIKTKRIIKINGWLVFFNGNSLFFEKIDK